MKPTAFIVHGHDDQAKAVLENFLISLGIQLIPFHRAAANDMSGTNLDAVLAGIERANVVFILFTADEQTTFTIRNRTVQGGARQRRAWGRWQPRPNVLIEAGIAAASDKKKTALIKVGTTRRISDIDGVRHFELPSRRSTRVWDFIRARVDIFRRWRNRQWRRSAGMWLIRLARWEFHDELEQLEADLRIPLGASRKTFIDVLVEYVRAQSIRIGTTERWPFSSTEVQSFS